MAVGTVDYQPEIVLARLQKAQCYQMTRIYCGVGSQLPDGSDPLSCFDGLSAEPALGDLAQEKIPENADPF